MTTRASRLVYLVTFDASLLAALLVAWFAPERGSHLWALGFCVALLVSHVDLLEGRTALLEEERGSARAGVHSRSRTLKALDSAQPTVFALSAVFAMVIRGSPMLLLAVAPVWLGVGFLSERANRSHRPGSRSAGTLTETWRARAAVRRFDVAYVLFFLALAALSLGLPEDPAVVVPVAVAAVIVAGVIAYSQGLAERRHRQASPTGSPSACVRTE